MEEAEDFLLISKRCLIDRFVADALKRVQFFYSSAPFVCGIVASGTCATFGYYRVLVKVFSAGELGSQLPVMARAFPRHAIFETRRICRAHDRYGLSRSRSTGAEAECPSSPVCTVPG